WVPPILTYDQVKPKTEQPSPDSYLIDVREPDEVVQGSIPSSVNIPLSVLPGSLYMKAEDFEKKFGFKKPRRDQEIIFYCRSGVRAATAGDIAKKNGYEKLYNYKGSWLEWVQKEGHK
ncbi:Rhodanese-like protein, partial [Thelephora ganbajun]